MYFSVDIVIDYFLSISVIYVFHPWQFLSSWKYQKPFVQNKIARINVVYETLMRNTESSSNSVCCGTRRVSELFLKCWGKWMKCILCLHARTSAVFHSCIMPFWLMKSCKMGLLSFISLLYSMVKTYNRALKSFQSLIPKLVIKWYYKTSFIT